MVNLCNLLDAERILRKQILMKRNPFRLR